MVYKVETANKVLLPSPLLGSEHRKPNLRNILIGYASHGLNINKHKNYIFNFIYSLTGSLGRGVITEKNIFKCDLSGKHGNKATRPYHMLPLGKN